MGGLFLKIEVNSIYEHQMFSREDSWCFLLEFCFGIGGMA